MLTIALLLIGQGLSYTNTMGGRPQKPVPAPVAVETPISLDSLRPQNMSPKFQDLAVGAYFSLATDVFHRVMLKRTSYTYSYVVPRAGDQSSYYVSPAEPIREEPEPRQSVATGSARPAPAPPLGSKVQQPARMPAQPRAAQVQQPRAMVKTVCQSCGQNCGGGCNSGSSCGCGCQGGRTQMRPAPLRLFMNRRS